MSGWRERLPAVRGRIALDAPLAPYTWLRVGGPADALFLPADEADLAGFLAVLDPGVPVMALGVGSNTLVRDGGIEGVVVRLGRGFAEVAVEGTRVSAGAAALDAQVARAAAAAGIGGLEFLTGVPGTIGGACVMNAGCYGAETKDVMVEVRALSRAGERVALSNAEMGFSYRRAAALARGDLSVVGATFEGYADEPAAVQARMAEITARREAAQPIREKTGGSTFKNPPKDRSGGKSAWELVDEVGWRGRPFPPPDGAAMFSPQHANFLINTGEATAADLEALGETVRAEVLMRTGVQLEWEVKRVGRTLR